MLRLVLELEARAQAWAWAPHPGCGEGLAALRSRLSLFQELDCHPRVLPPPARALGTGGSLSSDLQHLPFYPPLSLCPHSPCPGRARAALDVPSSWHSLVVPAQMEPGCPSKAAGCVRPPSKDHLQVPVLLQPGYPRAGFFTLLWHHISQRDPSASCSPRTPPGVGLSSPSEPTPGGSAWQPQCPPSSSPSSFSWTSRSRLSSSTARSTS